MLETLGRINVNYSLEYKVLIYIHSIISGITLIYLRTLSQIFQNIYNYFTRISRQFVLQKLGTTAAHKSIFSSDISKYNSLYKTTVFYS